MKVSELIEMLQDQDQDLEVKFAYNYGDYWRTTVAANPKYVEEVEVENSDYHRMDRVSPDEEEYDPADLEEGEEPPPSVRRRAVVIF